MTIAIDRTISPWLRLGMALGMAALVAALCLGVEVLWSPPMGDSASSQTLQQGAQQPVRPARQVTSVAPAGPSMRPPSVVSTSPKVLADQSTQDGPATPDPIAPFQVDAEGELRIDGATLQTLEQLLVRASGRPVAPLAWVHARALPAPLQAQAVALAERHEGYDAALKQAFSGSQEVPSVEALLADVHAMHALRVQWFGEALAEQLFGPAADTTAQVMQWASAAAPKP